MVSPSVWSFPFMMVSFEAQLLILMRSNLSNLCELPGIVSKKELPWWLNDKEFKCYAGDAEDVGLIPGLGRSPGEGNGIPLQYFCLGNPMDRGAWWAMVHGVSKSWT